MRPQARVRGVRSKIAEDCTERKIQKERGLA